MATKKKKKKKSCPLTSSAIAEFLAKGKHHNTISRRITPSKHLHPAHDRHPQALSQLLQWFNCTPSPPLPPPSLTALTSFPTNISSLMLPHTSSHSNRYILAVAVSAFLLSAALITALVALFLYFRRRRDRHVVGADQDDKASRSDSPRLYPPNTATSDGKSRATTPNQSSEFLYLGTLVNSR